jgi:hypothetical protein
MPRITKTTSISFDPQFLQAIEEAAKSLGMNRSQFISHCVRQEMLSSRGGVVTMRALPEDLRPKSRMGGWGTERRKTKTKTVNKTRQK